MTARLVLLSVFLSVMAGCASEGAPTASDATTPPSASSEPAAAHDAEPEAGEPSPQAEISEPAEDANIEDVTSEPSTQPPAEAEVPTGWVGLSLDGEQQELNWACHSTAPSDMWGARVADGPFVNVMYDTDDGVRVMNLWRGPHDFDEVYDTNVTDLGNGYAFAAAPGGTEVAMVVELPVPDGVPPC